MYVTTLTTHTVYFNQIKLSYYKQHGNNNNINKTLDFVENQMK
jgi:hypothetical protein